MAVWCIKLDGGQTVTCRVAWGVPVPPLGQRSRVEIEDNALHFNSRLVWTIHPSQFPETARTGLRIAVRYSYIRHRLPEDAV